jgi:zinc/manganese transport system substrate-binding protein
LVTQHRSLGYFFEWSGLVAAGYLEPKPGVPATRSHLAEVVGLMRRQHVKAIVLEAYYDTRAAEIVAKLAGARVLVIPGDVGWTPHSESYESYIDALVRTLADALR